MNFPAAVHSETILLAPSHKWNVKTNTCQAVACHPHCSAFVDTLATSARRPGTDHK